VRAHSAVDAAGMKIISMLDIYTWDEGNETCMLNFGKWPHRCRDSEGELISQWISNGFCWTGLFYEVAAVFAVLNFLFLLTTRVQVQQ
jgi:hypothetical protein